MESLFLYILIYSFLLPVLTFFLFFKSSSQKRALIIIALYSLIFFAFLFIQENNLISEKFKRAYNTLYTILEYLFISAVFYYNIESLRLKKIILLASGFFLLFLIVYSIGVQHKTSIDSIPIGIETILILIWIVNFYLEQFKLSKNQSIVYNYCFWFSVGVLIYLAGTFFFNILANSIDISELRKVWFFTYIFEIIKNILLSISIFIASKTTELKPKITNIPKLDFE